MQLQRLRDYDSQFGEYTFCRLLKFRIAQPAQQAHPDRDRIGFLAREHQGRQIVAAPQNISEPGRAFDRHAASLECCDVAINRADGHLELLGERRGGNRTPGGAQGLDDVEQAVSASHNGP